MANAYQIDEALRLINNVEKKKEFGRLQYMPQTLFSLANRVLTDVERRLFYFYVASGEGAEGKPFKPATSFICKETQIKQEHFHKYRQKLVDKGFIKVDVSKGTVEVDYDSIKKLMESKPEKEKGKQRGKWMKKPDEAPTTNFVVGDNDDWDEDTTTNLVGDSTTDFVVDESKITTNFVVEPTTNSVGIIYEGSIYKIENMVINNAAAAAAASDAGASGNDDVKTLTDVRKLLAQLLRFRDIGEKSIPQYITEPMQKYGLSYSELYKAYEEHLDYKLYCDNYKLDKINPFNMAIEQYISERR